MYRALKEAFARTRERRCWRNGRRVEVALSIAESHTPAKSKRPFVGIAAIALLNCLVPGIAQTFIASGWLCPRLLAACHLVQLYI